MSLQNSIQSAQAKASPNTQIRPITAQVINDHLVVGGCDTVDLANTFGTPLWVMDEKTIVQAIEACQEGLKTYPKAKVFYAGKAFLCLAICHLLKKLDVGIDVVSDGELFSAIKSGITGENILLHGNNKSLSELETALDIEARIVVDNESELKTIAKLAAQKGRQAKLFLRVIPGVTGKTHKYIQTGQEQSKFGLALNQLPQLMKFIVSEQKSLQLLGLHTHIGSQLQELEPYEQSVEVLALTYKTIKEEFGIELSVLNVGGGLGIAYTEQDKPVDIKDWAQTLSKTVIEQFKKCALSLPTLFIEPGRAIVGTAGITLYRVGYDKWTTDNTHYVAVDGGMADNPRPITYQAKYTANLANRMGAALAASAVTIVGKYCEQGDIIIKESLISPLGGDLMVVFGTGAYNASMASNYNRTGRPACVLVNDGQAEIIVERETNADLIRRDKVPQRFL
jgi:diaminopimelate decarboxylase